jgi:hypothetical protein
MTESRQQRRARERAERQLSQKIESFRKTSPLAEETYHAGYAEGWHAACNFAMKTCYAGATLALHDLEGYSTVRNTRFLRAMDNYITNTLTSEEIMDEALEKAGVSINFREPFTEDRVQEV